ncbi:MAG: zinc-ribbon domain-containing protein [Fimbriiglobus sp.]|nr:zinc-ribbon domain-containing protein [Fimbriiglobus sp.]
MPIDATCPGCQKPYKLRDELAGKTVKCSNPDCRKAFAIPGGTNGKAATKPKPKAKKEPEVDAEALAAQLFGESQEDAKPAAERTITVECVMCNFKWPEPESKAGKNAICPECKHRMKVPELKKKQAADWRDSTGGRRLLEKGPELPADLAEQQMREASISSLQQAGAIEEPELEPRPLREYLLMALIPLVVLSLGIGAVVWWMKSGATGEENAAIGEALKDVETLKDDTSPIPKDDRRLMRATLLIASGEYHARLETKEGIKEAVKAFAAARRELEAAPKSPYERDVLFAELLVAQAGLGGTDEQSASEVRIRWSVNDFKGKGPPVGSTVIDYVQTELRQTLTKFAEKDVDKGVRLSAVARLTKELCKRGKADLLFEIVSQGFAPDDAAEAQAFVLLVAARNNGPEDKIRAQLEALRGQLKATPDAPLPWPAVALFDKYGVTDVEVKGKIAPPIGEGASVSLTTRMAYSALYLSQEKLAEAVRLASGPPGLAYDRFSAMAALADLMADPKPLLEEAVKQVKDAQGGNRFHLYRLARTAADAGAADKAEALAKAIQDESLREWALAEAAHGKWAAGKSAAAAGELTLPADPAKTHAGHGWAALLFARHNAKATGDRKAGTQYDEWTEKKLRGFGYAGMALGLQDGK